MSTPSTIKNFYTEPTPAWTLNCGHGQPGKQEYVHHFIIRNAITSRVKAESFIKDPEDNTKVLPIPTDWYHYRWTRSHTLKEKMEEFVLHITAYMLMMEETTPHYHAAQILKVKIPTMPTYPADDYDFYNIRSDLKFNQYKESLFEKLIMKEAAHKYILSHTSSIGHVDPNYHCKNDGFSYMWETTEDPQHPWTIKMSWGENPVPVIYNWAALYDQIRGAHIKFLMRNPALRVPERLTLSDSEKNRINRFLESRRPAMQRTPQLYIPNQAPNRQDNYNSQYQPHRRRRTTPTAPSRRRTVDLPPTEATSATRSGMPEITLPPSFWNPEVDGPDHITWGEGPSLEQWDQALENSYRHNDRRRAEVNNRAHSTTPPIQWNGNVLTILRRNSNQSTRIEARSGTITPNPPAPPYVEILNNIIAREPPFYLDITSSTGDTTAPPPPLVPSTDREAGLLDLPTPSHEELD